MSLPVVYLPESRDDIDEAFLHYEQRSSGLGGRFAAAVHERVLRIQNNPELYGLVHQDIRGALLKHFPYVVYYRMEADRIVIVAVQHARRDWSNWKSRA